MKIPGYRIIGTCLIMAVFLVWPVCANPISTTLVNYSIYQNNQPIDASINLAVKCYGTYHENYFKARQLPENRSAITNAGLIYSYSLTCEPDNCFREDIYGYTAGLTISSCDLEGIYKGNHFFVKNFTVNPEPDCILTESLVIGGYGEKTSIQYYAINEEDLLYCNTIFRENMRNYCDKFLLPNRPAVGGENLSHEWRNNTWFYGTEDFMRCYKRINLEQRLCYENHSLTNLSILLKTHPSLYCEQRFDIPSHNKTSRECVNQTRNTYTPQSPIESLYCNILRMFGRRCE